MTAANSSPARLFIAIPRLLLVEPDDVRAERRTTANHAAASVGHEPLGEKPADAGGGRFAGRAPGDAGCCRNARKAVTRHVEGGKPGDLVLAVRSVEAVCR